MLTSFRQKVLEHKRHAIASLTAANTLKAVLEHAKTDAERIALMRHYVLEFGQAASRNVKLSNSLADDDPRKEKVDQDGVSATFAVSTLNSILSDIAPAQAYVPPGPTVHPTMAGRFGQVLSWTANVIALAIVAMFLLIAGNDTKDAGVIVLIGLVIAAVVWMAGRALRYILAGS